MRYFIAHVIQWRNSLASVDFCSQPLYPNLGSMDASDSQGTVFVMFPVCTLHIIWIHIKNHKYKFYCGYKLDAMGFCTKMAHVFVGSKG